MKLIIIALSLYFLSSCKETKQIVSDASTVNDIISSERRYKQYSSAKFDFNDKAIYLNEGDSVISRLIFFDNVYRRSYFPLKVKRADTYKLVKVNNWPNEYIEAWVRGEGYRKFKRESLIGKTLLKKPLTDMNGNTVDSNLIKDKHVFVKCWFIKCIPCLAEMPELNSIVDKMKDRKDILFLSFAYDRKDSLEKFLQTTLFKYDVFPTYKIPEIDSLGITSFPTHLYVRNNKVQRVINKEEILHIIYDVDKSNY